MSELRLADARTVECMTSEGRSTEAIAIVDHLLATGSAGLSVEMAMLQRVRVKRADEILEITTARIKPSTSACRAPRTSMPPTRWP